VTGVVFAVHVLIKLRLSVQAFIAKLAQGVALEASPFLSIAINLRACSELMALQLLSGIEVLFAEENLAKSLRSTLATTRWYCCWKSRRIKIILVTHRIARDMQRMVRLAYVRKTAFMCLVLSVRNQEPTAVAIDAALDQ
jgi:hypothetical protein